MSGGRVSSMDRHVVSAMGPGAQSPGGGLGETVGTHTGGLRHVQSAPSVCG